MAISFVFLDVENFFGFADQVALSVNQSLKAYNLRNCKETYKTSTQFLKGAVTQEGHSPERAIINFRIVSFAHILMQQSPWIFS